VSKRLFIPSPWANIKRELVTDNVTGAISVIMHEDLDMTLKANERQRFENPQGIVDGDRDVRTLARIPASLCHKIFLETGIDLLGNMGSDLAPEQWNTLCRKYLNNSEYSKIRTSDLVA
jgi:hypothetical protein